MGSFGEGIFGVGFFNSEGDVLTMSAIKNKFDIPIGHRDPYGVKMEKGSNITPENEQGESILRMERVAIGIRNAGGSDITIAVIPAQGDIVTPFPIAIAAGERWSDCRFNAVLVAGSTGHDSATTYYIYE